MNVNYLSQLPVDVFIKSITYLPFKDQKLRSFCNNLKYNNKF